MNEQIKEDIRQMLQTLHDSCREGEYEYWEPSKEGFAAMAENVEEVAGLLGIKIEESYTGVENGTR